MLGGIFFHKFWESNETKDEMVCKDKYSKTIRAKVEEECKKDDFCKGYVGEKNENSIPTHPEHPCDEIETFYLCKSFEKAKVHNPDQCNWLKRYSKNTMLQNV